MSLWPSETDKRLNEQYEVYAAAREEYRKKISEQAARIEELEGQHKGLVLQNALLRQRPDLPVDRIPAAQEVRALIDRIGALEAALRPLACTCKERHPEGCSSGEVDCPFWNARAALGEKA